MECKPGVEEDRLTQPMVYQLMKTSALQWEEGLFLTFLPKQLHHPFNNLPTSWIGHT